MISSRVARKINLPLAFLFASGALLTTAVVHIIPDAMDGLAPEYEDDPHGLFLRSSISVMAGIYAGFLLHVALDTGGGGGGGGGGSHTHSMVPQPRTGAAPAAAAAAAAVSDEASLGNGGPAEAVTGKAPQSSVPEGRDGACCGGAAAAGADETVGRESQATTTEDVSDEDSSGCAANEMEEGGGRGRRRPSDTREAAARLALMSSLHDARGAGAGRGLFDFRGLEPICWNVVCGDLAHNFSDGVTMGAAFLGCSPTVGWTITAANMMHEIPHEIGNFMALVNGGMSVKQVGGGLKSPSLFSQTPRTREALVVRRLLLREIPL